jgi:NAD(P)H dehydrogenase (quinone)
LVLEALLKAGAKLPIATTRTPEKLTDLASRVEVRQADFKTPEALVAAFQGATKLLLISTTDIGARAADQTHAVRAAKQAGVQHIFYTSLPNPETSVAIVAPDHVATERAIKESGLTYTFLRNSYYAENLLMSLGGAVASGTLFGCAGDGKAAYVTRADCAAAAAAALMNAPSVANAAIDITGPAAWSHAELAAMTGELLGKNIGYQDLSSDEFKAAVVKAGFPEMYAPFFVSMDTAIKNGSVARVTNEVQRLTGRPAQDVRDVLRQLGSRR